MTARQMLSRRISAAGLAPFLLAVQLLAPIASASDGGVSQVRLSLGESGVALEVPGYCLLREGPGTAEAVCDPHGSAEASRLISAAAAVYLEVTAQPFGAPGSGQSTDVLAQRYAFADFQKDLPGAVCGEERISRIRIESPQRQVGEGRITYAATITCPEVKFLGLGPRRALVRYILTDGTRINVMARSLAEDFEHAKAVIDAFVASVTLQGEKRP